MDGAAVRIRVPATSANLGPGLDSVALALGLYNDVTVGMVAAGTRVSIVGEGSDQFATGEDNLVARAARAALAELGAPATGLDLQCTNRIPAGRGLGSSAAAIVAGVVAGGVLAHSGDHADDRPDPAGSLDPAPPDPASSEPPQLDLDWVLDLAARLEGHPDNVAACLLGGVTIAWYDDDSRVRAVRADPAADLIAVALVPTGQLSTAEARRLLPSTVPLTDAAHSAGRSALLSLALTTRTDLLFPATEDRLHQSYRSAAMPESAALVARVRANGLAAVISGAGPTVLVVGQRSSPVAGASQTEDQGLLAAIAASNPEGFSMMQLETEHAGVRAGRLAGPNNADPARAVTSRPV